MPSGRYSHYPHRVPGSRSDSTVPPEKLVSVWSAMRHFARELEESGGAVTYIRQAENFEVPLNRWIEANDIDELWAMEPGGRPFARAIENLGLSTSIRRIPDNHFIWSRAEFQDRAESRKRPVMEEVIRAVEGAYRSHERLLPGLRVRSATAPWKMPAP